MPELDVSGARLHYQIHGKGPLFLCISGANGDYEVWEALAQELSNRFTVVMYDRRGFSRSALVGAQDYSQRLETDADDAAALIQHLSPQEPATVIGNSSGAIVALTLLYRHPDRLRLLIAHEPPAFKLQAGADTLFTEQQAIYDTYRAGGVTPAMERFAVMIKATPPEVKALQSGYQTGLYRYTNRMYWFEREMLVYPMADFSVEQFRPLSAKLMTVNGQDSNNEALQYVANVNLAKGLGLELVILPGAHGGFATHPSQFAEAMVEALCKRDDFYTRL